ncbi:hypothetical protein FRIG_15805, partial [Frigoribacterium faeni]|nr:hypothetical protein [Frigoribacterium faeni]
MRRRQRQMCIRDSPKPGGPRPGAPRPGNNPFASNQGMGRPSAPRPAGSGAASSMPRPGGAAGPRPMAPRLSLIHISEPTRRQKKNT